jgi:hypothetical protein
MVRLPSGATMESYHTAELNTPELSAAASIAHVFPGIQTILYSMLGNYATRATQSLSRKPRSQFAIPRSFKF